jgi:hypothetical protein
MPAIPVIPQTIFALSLALFACSPPSSAARLGTTRAGSYPRFDRSLLLETSAETSANVSIGDVNGDGHLDLILAKGRHWPLVDRVLLTDGHGHITSAYDLGAASDRSYSGKLVDLDRDGDLDVVISNDTPDPKRIYMNDGTGHFQEGASFGRAEWETRNAGVADVNGDGLPDIIVANRSENGTPNYLCLNRGQGRFDAECLAISPDPATTITPADFNADGMVDLAVPHRDRGQSFVYLNGGRGTFPTGRRVPFGPQDARIRMTEAADLDGDGVLDLVAIDEGKGVAIYFGQKNGGFAPGVEVADSTVTPFALAVSDLNTDGRLDIVVGHVEAPSTVYFNQGNGRQFANVSFGDDKGTVYGFAIADLDEDGRQDIAVGRSDAPNVVYFGGYK